MIAKGKDRMEELRAALEIDKYALDEALERYPKLLLEVLEEQERAISLRDEYKTTMEETYATESARVRKEFERRDEKATEQRIKDAVSTSNAYRTAVDKYYAQKEQASKLSALSEAHRERGRALAKLADLYAAGYWAQSSVGRAGDEVRDRTAEHAREQMRQEREMRAIHKEQQQRSRRR